MTEEKLDIEIELCGYKARITHIFTREAYPPWHPEDIFYVNVEFDEPHPENIISTAISVPVKYASGRNRDDLLYLIKTEGEKQVSETLAKHRKEREDMKSREQRREELDALAKRMEELLKDVSPIP